MIRRPPRSTRTATLFPYTTLFRSASSERDIRSASSRPALAGLVMAALSPNGIEDRFFLLIFTQPIRTIFPADAGTLIRSEEHTSELQSLMRTSYAVFCLKKKKQTTNTTHLSILTTTTNKHNH